jgi:hypothetical protein
MSRKLRNILLGATMLGNMGVNWKRGLFRVWVVLSVAWLVLAGILFGPGAFNSLPELPKLPKTEMIEKSVELAHAYHSGTMPERKQPYYVEALRRGLLVEIRPMHGKKNAPDKNYFIEQKAESATNEQLLDELSWKKTFLDIIDENAPRKPVPSDELEIVLKDQTVITNVPADVEAKEIDRRISNFFQDRRSKELRSRILGTSAWLFIPPAVLFIVGIGMYWVAAGFRKGAKRLVCRVPPQTHVRRVDFRRMV